jgi:hypothetical protein
MPGMLLRGVARTAVVAGTATAVSNRVSRRQTERWAEQNPQPDAYYGQAPAAPAPSADPIEKLKELGELRDKGVLTEAEFAEQKAKLLAS